MKLSFRSALAALCLLVAAPVAAMAQPAGGSAGIGTPNDAAWSGSGQGTVVAIDKSIRNLLAGTLTVNLPSGAATAANQTSANTKLDTLHGDLTGTLTVGLPSGAATAANQSTGNGSLSTIATNTTGVATAANQSTGNSSLSSIDTKLSSQATAANQTSANTKLDTLHTDLTSATPAGTAIIGKVGIDQTTPGTTNGVTIAPSSASAVGIAPATSSSAEACHVFKASAGNLYGVSGYIGAAGYIMVFNATSAPVDGAVTPAAWAYVPTAGSWSINYGSLPAYLSTGVTVCASSTGPLTKTAFSTNTVFSGRVQ